MNHEASPYKAHQEELASQEKKDFLLFVHDNSFTAGEVREAYHRLLGISENTEETPEVTAILKKLEEITEKGFPLNALSTFIEYKDDLEASVPKYIEYVESLSISPGEKKMLKSLIQNNRKGELSVFIGEQVAASAKIHIEEKDKDMYARELKKIIEKVVASVPEGKKYEFAFSE